MSEELKRGAVVVGLLFAWVLGASASALLLALAMTLTLWLVVGVPFVPVWLTLAGALFGLGCVRLLLSAMVESTKE